MSPEKRIQIIPLNSRGMSLVETLVAIAIMAVFMSVFAQSQANQSKQTKILSEKLAMLDLEKVLIGSLATGTTCAYPLTEPSVISINLNGLSPTNPIRVPVNRPIPASILPGGLPGPTITEIGSRISPDPSSPILQNIDLVITEGSAGSYKGYWEFRMDQAAMTGRFKPVRISTILNLDITNPAAATVQSCMGDSTPAATAPITRIAYGNGTAWRWPSAVATCASDEYLLSGGGHCYSGIGWMWVTRSYPTTSMNGWVIGCDTSQFIVASATAYAICAKR